MHTQSNQTEDIYNILIHSLDKYKHNSNNTTADNKPRNCGKYVLVGPSNNNGRTLVRRQFCKAYGCPTCGEIKKHEMIKNIARLFTEHNLTVFATMTLPPSLCAKEESVKRINKMWNQHRIMQKRELGRLPLFVKVVELQKNGMAHLHLLFDQNIPHAWLYDSWKRLGGGFVFLNEANIRSAYYMGKYLSKSNDKAAYGNYRRISVAKGLKLNNRLKNKNFAFSMAHYENLKKNFNARITETTKRKSGLETGFEIDGLIELYCK